MEAKMSKKEREKQWATGDNTVSGDGNTEDGALDIEVQLV